MEQIWFISRFHQRKQKRKIMNERVNVLNMNDGNPVLIILNTWKMNKKNLKENF